MSDSKSDLPPEERERTLSTEAFAENRYLKLEFTEQSIKVNAPVVSGLYGLYNVVWIYLGETENIRAQLLQHLADDHLLMGHHRPSGFAFEVVLSPEERACRLAKFSKELELLYQRDRTGSLVRKARSGSD